MISNSASIQRIDGGDSIPSLDNKQFTSYIDGESKAELVPSLRNLNALNEGIESENKKVKKVAKVKYIPPSMISYDKISFKNRNNNQKQLNTSYSKTIINRQKRIANLNKSIDFGRENQLQESSKILVDLDRDNLFSKSKEVS